MAAAAPPTISGRDLLNDAQIIQARAKQPSAFRVFTRFQPIFSGQTALVAHIVAHGKDRDTRLAALVNESFRAHALPLTCLYQSFAHPGNAEVPPPVPITMRTEARDALQPQNNGDRFILDVRLLDSISPQYPGSRVDIWEPVKLPDGTTLHCLTLPQIILHLLFALAPRAYNSPRRNQIAALNYFLDGTTVNHNLCLWTLSMAWETAVVLVGLKTFEKQMRQTMQDHVSGPELNALYQGTANLLKHNMETPFMVRWEVAQRQVPAAQRQDVYDKLFAHHERVLPQIAAMMERSLAKTSSYVPRCRRTGAVWSGGQE
ncbi:hypothetical protein JCM11641_006491 [Rhodosporidiobolus odoratus]